VFTARCALSPYIKQIRFVFKGLIGLPLENEKLQEIKKCIYIHRLFNGVLADAKLVLRQIAGSSQFLDYSVTLHHIPEERKRPLHHCDSVETRTRHYVRIVLTSVTAVWLMCSTEYFVIWPGGGEQSCELKQPRLYTYV
jgi:hypothetical protein